MEIQTIYKILSIVVLFMIFFVPASAVINFKAVLQGVDYYNDPNYLMRKEYHIAKELALFPHIRDMTIAIGDTGVIPYYTEANIIDTVGLNDYYIAREKNINKCIDYLFEKNPTLYFMASDKDYTWITYGHGNMGNLAIVSLDERWKNYQYVGTIHTSYYELQLFLIKNYEYFKQFQVFLKNNIVDEIYDPIPFSIGKCSK